MRIIAHLSDLHFGRVDADLLGPLRERLHQLAPHLVVVSGDLTQRARSAQFAQAKQFLDSLPQPQLIVPGNHDVPLHNVFARFFQPLKKYSQHISAELNPVFVDAEIAVVGLNSARAMTFKDGRVNAAQLGQVRAHFCATHSELIKIVVTHHPFDLPSGHDEDALIDRAPAAMAAFAECGADVLLSGHLHLSLTTDSQVRYPHANFSALIVQAGTATSTRGRGETNTFNVLYTERDEIEVQRYAWEAAARSFNLKSQEQFRRRGALWLAK